MSEDHKLPEPRVVNQCFKGIYAQDVLWFRRINNALNLCLFSTYVPLWSRGSHQKLSVS